MVAVFIYTICSYTVRSLLFRFVPRVFSIFDLQKLKRRYSLSPSLLGFAIDRLDMLLPFLWIFQITFFLLSVIEVSVFKDMGVHLLDFNLLAIAQSSSMQKDIGLKPEQVRLQRMLNLLLQTFNFPLWSLDEDARFWNHCSLSSLRRHSHPFQLDRVSPLRCLYEWPKALSLGFKQPS